MQSDNDIEMQRKAFEAAWQQVTGLEAPPLRSPNNSDCYYYSTTEKMWALWQVAVLREREKWRADARRYQWLRERVDIDYCLSGKRALFLIPDVRGVWRTNADELDAAINQALPLEAAQEQRG